MKTFSAKPSDVKRQWHLLDASTSPLGRLSTVAASLLTGKHKTQFTKHIDTGDYVVVVNSDQLKVTGNKMNDKKYYRHSGHPGNLKTTTLKEQIAKDSTKAVIHAIRGMIPDNKLRKPRLLRLKVYKTGEHPHTAQDVIPYKTENK